MSTKAGPKRASFSGHLPHVYQAAELLGTTRDDDALTIRKRFFSGLPREPPRRGLTRYDQLATARFQTIQLLPDSDLLKSDMEDCG